MLKKNRQQYLVWKNSSNSSEKTHVTQKFLTNKFMGSLISSFSTFPHMLYLSMTVDIIKENLEGWLWAAMPHKLQTWY